MVARYVPKLPTGTSKIDWLSGAVSLVAVLGVVLALQQGPELGWGTLIWVSLAVGIAAAVLFIWMQTRSKAPLMPLRIFKTRNFAIGAFSIFSLGFTVYSVNLPIMLYLQTAQGMSSQLAGLMLVPMGIISVVMSPVIGRLVDRLAPGMISKIGFGALIFSMALMAVFMISNLSPWWLLIPIILFGSSNAMSFAPNSAIALRDVPQDLVGSASGFYNTSRQVGAVLGAATLGAVMQIGVGTVSFGVAMGAAILVTLVPLIFGFLAVTQFR